MSKGKGEKKIILDLCGGTGSWSKPYKNAGFEVWNITLPEYDVTHTQFYPESMNVGKMTGENEGSFATIWYKDVYGILAAPPCTEFSKAKGNLPRDFESAMEVVSACLRIIWQCRSYKKLQFWALENPMGFLRQFLGNPPYNFEPWMFGDFYTKNTDLWGYFNLPRRSFKTRPFLLVPVGKKTHSAALSDPKCPPEYKHLKLNRAAIRAITPQGFAKAFMEANR